MFLLSRNTLSSHFGLLTWLMKEPHERRFVYVLRVSEIVYVHNQVSGLGPKCNSHVLAG